MSYQRFICFIAIGLCLHSSVFGAPVTQPAGLEQQVAGLLKQLDSESYEEREAAADSACHLPVAALPLLEAARKDSHLATEVRAQLDIAIKTLTLARDKQTTYQDYLAFYRDYYSGEYDRAGNKSPKWDAAVHQYFESVSRKYADEMDGRDSDTDLSELIKPVLATGCEDLQIRAHALRFSERPCTTGELDQFAADVEASAYSDLRKGGMLNWVAQAYPNKTGDPIATAKAREYYRKSISLWPAAIAQDAGIPTKIALNWLVAIVEDDKARPLTRKAIWDLVDASLATKLPEESILRLNLKGAFLIKYAWDARGSGWASTVTADQRKIFAERLAEADKTLTRCYELFPDDPHAATKMLSVELGQGKGRTRMEMWFARAMKADPGNFAACGAKMWYLAPRWYGSKEEQLQFGRECLATGQFDSAVPLMVVTAHLDAAPNSAWAPETAIPYLAKEDVWADISLAYTGYIEQHPVAWQTRSRYAYHAWCAGKWQTASDLYKSLDDAPARFRNDDLTRVVRKDIAHRLAERPDDPSIRASALRLKTSAEFKKLLLESYDRVGRKNAKWDDAARAALEASAKTWGGDPDCKFSEHDTMLESSKQAIDAGCDDPLIRFIYSNSVDSYVIPREGRERPTGYADGLAMAKSDYPATLRLRALSWSASFEINRARRKEGPGLPAVQEACHTALGLIRAAAAEHLIDDRIFRRDLSELLDFASQVEDDPQPDYERAIADLKAAGADPHTIDCVSAAAYMHFYHTDIVRGRDLGKHRDPAVVRANVAKAEALCEKLWDEDPTDAWPSIIMLYADWSTHREQRWRDFWFHQAMRAEPSSRYVAEAYFYSLITADVPYEVQWGFAYKCAAMADYRTQIPFLETWYLDRLARTYVKTGEKPDGVYLGRKDIWPILAAVYEAHLARFPLDSDRRSEYASYACLVGRWPLASEQFKILGDRIRPRAFYTQDRFDACRKHINELTGKGFLPESKPADP